jgi:ribosome-associated protein
MKKPLNKLQQIVVDAAAEKKAFNILVMDLRLRSDLTDCFIICSGNSKPHVQAIADSILEKTAQSKFQNYVIEGYSQGNWIVMDLGDLMVHVFQKDVRLHYDLERLWGDVPVFEAVGQ